MTTLQQRLIKTFLAELDERAEAFDRDLLALEKEESAGPRLALFNSLFRTAHSLKGAAGAADAAIIEDVCHRLEAAFGAARQGRITLAPDCFRLFFAAVDAIKDYGRGMRENPDLALSPLPDLLAQLDAAIATAPGAVPPVPAADPEPVAGASMRLRADDGVVRVAAQKLDLLLARSSELLAIDRRTEMRIEDVANLRALAKQCRLETGSKTPADRSADLRHLGQTIDRLDEALCADRRASAQTAAALDAEIREVRMLPFAVACEGFERVVRDLGKTGGKEAELVVTGGDIELDRSIIEGLKGPLLHLLRNAVDHGIEPIARRRAAGKKPVGRITIAAALSGAQIKVTVGDDGPGLDLAAIAAQARARNLPAAAGQELARYVFLPGFSTAPTVTTLSGRGVGLDAVKTDAEAMRGAVEVSFEAGRGTRFTLVLPLTLTTIRALIVEAQGHSFAIDGACVVRLLRASPTRLASVDGRNMIVLDDGPVPVVALGPMLGLEGVRAEGGSLPLVIVSAEGRRVAILVDELVGEQDVLVRHLGRRLVRLRHLAGATFLPNGRIAFILNAADLVRTARGRTLAPIDAAPAPAQPAAARTRVLLVDDSLTTRTLERSILEVAGYEVTAAADGDEAWRILQANGADIVVSDIEMPRMDGLAFTEAIRASKRFKDLPIILVTALSSEEDRLRGLQLGANAYLVKNAFEQKSLLDAIAQLV